jgi:predicted aspartyl protease
MRFSFTPHQGLVVVQVEIEGPLGIAILRLALDTGATSTLINVAMLVSLGYDPGLSHNRIEVTTGSGVEFAPQITLSRIKSLGQERTNFLVLAHTLPSSAGVDGLLGLDFLRGENLNIDFRSGHITLG